MTKKATVVSAESNNSKFEVSTDRNGDLYEDITIGKTAQKGKTAEKVKGKKMVPQESDLPSKGLRRKNPTTFLPHTP